MPGSGGQMMKLLDDVQTVIEGNFVVSRGYFGKKYWQRYQKEVEQGQKKIDERSRLRIDSYKKLSRRTKHI